MKLLCQQTLPLTRQNIAEIVAAIESAGRTVHCKSREAVYTQMVIEDILLAWLNQVPGQEVTVSIQQTLFHLRIRILQKGAPLQNSAAGEAPEDEVLSRWLRKVGEDVECTYAGGRNLLSASLRYRAIDNTFLLLAAILGGIVAGAGLKYFFPEQAVSISTNFLNPAYKALMGILMTFAIPVIFLSLLDGMTSIGNPRQLSSLGRSLLGKMGRRYCVNAFSALFLLLLVYPVYGVRDGGSGGIHADMLAIFFDFIPENIFQPFVNGDLLQIAMIAVILGVAAIYHRDEMLPVINLLHAANTLFASILGSICRLLPLIIFFGLCDLVAMQDLAGLSLVGSMLACCVALDVLLFCLDLLQLGIQFRQNPFFIVKKLRAPLLTGLATASSMAAFPLLLKLSRPGLGLHENISRFAIPLNQILYKIGSNATALTLTIGTCCYFGITLSWPMLILLALISSLASILTLPVSGGALAPITFMFQLVGLPPEAVSIGIVVFTLADYPNTMENIMGNMTLTLLTAHQLGHLDKAVLRS